VDGLARLKRVKFFKKTFVQFISQIFIKKGQNKKKSISNSLERNLLKRSVCIALAKGTQKRSISEEGREGLWKGGV
jgi:hypothetical protein